MPADFVSLELSQRLVQGFLQRGVVLGDADGVVLVGILGVQNGQTINCRLWASFKYMNKKFTNTN